MLTFVEILCVERVSDGYGGPQTLQFTTAMCVFKSQKKYNSPSFGEEITTPDPNFLTLLLGNKRKNSSTLKTILMYPTQLNLKMILAEPSRTNKEL